MKNLIYQYWDDRHHTPRRTNLAGVNASWKQMKKYAQRIGATHLAETNPPLLHNLHSALYYGAFNPIYREEFHEYDNVLFLDSDVHPVDNLTANIFETMDPTADIGICMDPLTAKLRATTNVGQINKHQDDLWATTCEKRWNITLPRTKEGYVKHYNSGVVLYSNKGMLNAKQTFIPFADYINHVLSVKGLLPFYAADQNYLGIAMFAANLKIHELDNSWNVLVTVHEKNDRRIIFDRDENTKFVHLMGIVGCHHFTEKRCWTVANLPVEQWGDGCKNVTNELKAKK